MYWIGLTTGGLPSLHGVVLAVVVKKGILLFKRRTSEGH